MIVDLDTVDPEYLVELGKVRLEARRRAREEAIARAADLLDRPALGHYLSLLKEEDQ